MSNAQIHTITNCTEEALHSAMASGGIVRFACDGRIALQHPLTNEVDLIIDGNGHNVSISGQGFCQVFFVKSNVSLSLLGLKIADGRSYFGGAGVYNDGGRLIVQACSFSNNLAQSLPWHIATASVGTNAFGGAVFNSGFARIANSIFVSNTAAGGAGGEGTNRGWTACGDGGNGGEGGKGLGGAVYNLGELNLLGCTIYQNAAIGGAGGEGGRGGGGCIGGGDGGFGGPGGRGWGGGLFNSGIARVVNTTFAQNTGVGGSGGAGGSGGGSFSMYGGDGGDGNMGGTGFGGAIYDQTGACFLTNCTVALNKAVPGPGGRAGYGGSANYGNGANGIAGQPGMARGGGLDSNEASVLVNVLLSENAPENLTGSFIDGGHNLSSDDSEFAEPGSLTNTPALLSALTDNGGPTPTMALMPGSHAIDAGNTSLAPPVDQRGESRPIGLACDIGAYEAGRPGIVTHPASLWTPWGGTIELYASVAGYAPLAYLWYFNATNLLAATPSPSLGLANIHFGQSGDYTIVATNSLGAATSSPARIEVFSRIVTSAGEDNLRASLSLGDRVTFACDGTITLSRPLTVETNTTLDAGPHQIAISGEGTVQLFRVASNVTLNLVGLTLTRGLGTNGGAVWSAGEVNATNCVFSWNTAQGPNAGYQAWPPIGEAGLGGAVYSSGILSIESCSFLRNAAIGGAGTPDMGGAGGLAAGGATYSLGPTTVSRSLFASNSVAGGKGGRGRAGMASGDQAWPGEPGGSGGAGLGGALFQAGDASMVSCTVAWNSGEGGGGGEGGPGGWVWHDGYLFTAPAGPNGPGGSGSSAIYSTNAFLRVTSSTIAANVAAPGPGGHGTALGALAGESFVLLNTILADNAPSNSSGTLSDVGHNLSSDSSCPFTASSSLTNTDPKLGPLADNAGPTLSMALLPGSPAIDSAKVASAPMTDQRGGARPAGIAPDMGAYEYGSVLRLRISQSQAGECGITLAEILAPSCRLLTSVDFSAWVAVATNYVGPEGTSLFRVPLDATNGRRFYRVDLP